MEALIKCQEDLYSRIEKARINFKKSPKERLSSVDYITTRLECLEVLWVQFSSYHTRIILETDATLLNASVYTTEDLYTSAEELFTQYKSELKAALRKLNVTSLDAKSESSVSQYESASSQGLCQGRSEMIKLPKISIPTFSGNYSEWTSFRDLFTSLIHKNQQLDNVQKLHYLKGYLVGEAEQLLRHVQITHDNYAACWEKLEKRYNNKKFLSNCILKRFMSQKNIATESASALKELLDTTNECLNGLRNLGIDTTTWDIIVIHIICLKLDNETRKQWELKVSEASDDLPTLNQLEEFIETRFRALECFDAKSSKMGFTPIKHNVPFNSNPKVHHVSEGSCAYCSQNHKLFNCKGFAKLDVNARRDFIQSGNFCFNCLGSGHNVYTCRQTTRCRMCKRKHHSLLHPTNVTASTDSQVKSTQSVDGGIVAHATTAANSSSSHNVDEPTNVTTCFSTSRGQVLLATALVQAQSKTGSGVTLRCLLDQGSQASFITESAVQLLGLKKIPHKSTVSGLGSEGSSSIDSKSVVNVQISSLRDPDFKIDVHAFVLGKLTSVLPTRRVVVELWSELTNLELADPTFNVPGKIDMLLGADIYAQILLEGIMKKSPGAPIAQSTSLGWIISGPITSGYSVLHNNISVNHVHLDENELLKKFWELEADNIVTDPKQSYTEEEKKCEELFAATTERDSTGRYKVKLPFRNSDPQCKYGNSEAVATRRFMQLEKRFAKDSQMKKRYSDVINEYIELNHMEVVPTEQRRKPDAVYLPHHAVVREDKTTSKVRVVFDASCPGTNGVSLNQDLLVGPTLQPPLRQTILRWRCHPICLVGDIVKMYRQVKVHEDDIDFQRIVWRENSEEELKHLRLLRVTFGTASAPYLAVRALQQAAYDEGEQHPTAADRILKHFYVDDLLTGCESVEEGKQTYKELGEILDKCGFELQKWSSNNEELLRHINQGNGEVEGNLQLKTDEVMKILGLVWNRRNDEFEYRVQLPPLKVPVTKRHVISDISRLFDPLGWLAPVIITAKIFIQRLWLSGIEWDTEVPPQLLKDWLSYRENLNQLTKFKLPRWNHASSDVVMELQGFCDASNEAYAAVVYLRTVDKDGNVHVSLIASKTKVAPIKQISIPRMELCGAVLLTKLMVEVAAAMKVDQRSTHAWTDSTVVLSWLNSRPNRWKTFVANRVSEIITSIEPSQWSHVSSKDNPADCASRGTQNLENEELWKEGPQWLKNKKLNYTKLNIRDTNMEEKSNKICLVNTYGNTDDSTEDEGELLISKFSKLRKLIRVVAFCKRFVKCARKERISLWLTSIEIQESLKICIKLTQARYFKEELRNLKENKMISKKSQLTSLNPIIDEDGILRVGGRLNYAGISDQMKHPIIIPSKSHFTTLILDNAHEKTLHGNPQLMLNYLRSNYFVIGATSAMKFFVRKCVKCVRFAAAVRHPLMGQLPSVRGTVNRAFYQSGVDYAGPISLRTSKGRGHRSYKGYICLFICMATRAIHLEVVSDLTAQGFLAAFKRFTARRGHCADLWSDNGTNFVGAARELKHLYAQERSSVAVEIADQLANNCTNWHWIPPHSPNFGGLWEAGVKSTKHHLRRVIGNSTLTYEEMATVLSQIEACLNSRPMSRITDNSGEQLPLTPGHFLVGEPLVLVPDSNYETANISSLRRWQLTQKMVQDFWRRWSREYLTQFYHRYKWAHQTPEPAVGSIVLVKEDDLPPAKWLYGIITDKHVGLDGITRVVSLRCKGNMIKRSVGKLCFLPIET